MKRMTAVLLLAAGCGGDERELGQKRVSIKLEEVPENILKIAEAEHKNMKLKPPAFKKYAKDGSFISYEVRAQDPKTGKMNEVGISPEGKVLERD
jgi:hypothetical protein